MKGYLKKYSVQLGIATAVAGGVMAVLPQFQVYLDPSISGIITSVCGVLVVIGRVIPQLK